MTSPMEKQPEKKKKWRKRDWLKKGWAALCLLVLLSMLVSTALSGY